MSQEMFENKQAVINAISEVAEPSIPVAIAVQEAEDLYQWCLADKEQLTNAGLDWNFVTDLPMRTGALRYLQSLWRKEYQSFEDAQKEWAEKSPLVFELHDDLIHHFYHAYYAIPDLYSKVQKIADGSGNADMVQDLSDLAVLGKGNPAPLQKIKLDMELLNAAATKSAEMATLLAKANGARMSDNKTKIIRDKAYAHLKEAVDEIRRNGQYVFYRDPSKMKGYVSRYLKQQNHRVRTNKKETNPE
jgi:hypothetical protein